MQWVQSEYTDFYKKERCVAFFLFLLLKAFPEEVNIKLKIWRLTFTATFWKTSIMLQLNLQLGCFCHFLSVNTSTVRLNLNLWRHFYKLSNCSQGDNFKSSSKNTTCQNWLSPEDEKYPQAVESAHLPKPPRW